LNTTNEELGARGGELERIANERKLELERSTNTISLLAAALHRTSGALAVTDSNGVIVSISDSYRVLAEDSGGHLPAVGARWSRIPEEIRLTDGLRETTTFRTQVSSLEPQPSRAAVIQLVAHTATT